MQRQAEYRQLIPMTWEQYLDEPVEVVEWTLRIASLKNEIQSEAIEAAKNANRGNP